MINSPSLVTRLIRARTWLDGFHQCVKGQFQLHDIRPGFIFSVSCQAGVGHQLAEARSTLIGLENCPSSRASTSKWHQRQTLFNFQRIPVEFAVGGSDRLSKTLPEHQPIPPPLMRRRKSKDNKLWASVAVVVPTMRLMLYRRDLASAESKPLMSCWPWLPGSSLEKL